MKACTKAQARTAVQICRDRIGLGTPFINQYEVSRTLKWYVPPRDTNAIQATLSRAGIPHHFKINGRWPKKIPAQVRRAMFGYGMGYRG